MLSFDTISAFFLIRDLYFLIHSEIHNRTGNYGPIDPTPCSCGPHLPRLTNFSGRQIDFFINSKGEKKNPYYLLNKFVNLPLINWQIIQENRTHFHANINTDGNQEMNAAIKKEIIKHLTFLMNGPITLSLSNQTFDNNLKKKVPLFISKLTTKGP